MDDWVDGAGGDLDLRYTCPKCKRIFVKPTADWLCPSCRETLRVVGALRLRDKRQRPGGRRQVDPDSLDL